jgi:signal transduction histidine kinase
MNESDVKILLVDDEPMNLDALEAILDEPSYHLLRASEADTALKLLLDHDVAAIVLDIKMPGVTGFELAEMIKGTKRFRQIPIVFLTAYMVDDEHVITGYGAGGVDYLTKPVNPQILRHKIAVFADLFRKTRALAELNNSLEERVRERTAELEQSESLLRAANRQKDEFLAILAHELRNPLAPLRMGVDILIQHKHAESPPIVNNTLARMDRQLDHVVRLIDDLMDISRISRGVFELQRHRVDLAEIVRGSIENERPLVDRRKHDLSIELAEAIPTHADGTRVAQIIGNLLHNAAKFTPDGGTISVELARDAGDAVLRIRDTGEGIPTAQLERVFDMFARIERTAASADRGLGIGLALARRLAEMHGGTLVASSEGVGKGTTFTLRLPIVDAQHAERSASGVARPTLVAGMNILIIEDNEDVADTMSTWLEEQGHRVWIARSGLLGVDMVQQNRPDLVLCDLGLPGVDGLEVCKRIRALQIPRQPIMVALTGWGRDEDRRRTKDAGFDEHLVKPVASDRLRQVLRAVSS